MKKLITPLLVVAALVGGFLSAHQLDAQVTYSPQQGYVKRGTVDPTAGGGVAGVEGTLYVRTGGTDQLWQKTGAGSTAWTQVALAGGAGSFSTIMTTGDASIGGRTTSAGFSSSIAGTAGLPAYKLLTTGNGMFEDGTTRVAIATNSADKAYWSTTVNHNYQTTSYAGGISSVSDINMSGNLTMTAGYIVLTERAAPGAAAADTVRIYAVVDGGSKTDLTSIFQSGAAQEISAEP